MKYANILQIDDDYDDCEFFKEALESISPAKYTAQHNPLEALRKLLSNELQPDLIFLDINMPTMDGPTLLEEIKKHENVQKIPVILFSTSPLAAHHQTKKIDVKEYLTKPGDFNDLIKMLKRVLEIY
ncbi:response regulator [Flavobacterium sp. TMP13]|uniref:response regulator n=1 Tax=Flavobacterium sp. TMP13 TaxID=3425950 RepID=UPI003D7786DD